MIFSDKQIYHPVHSEEAAANPGVFKPYKKKSHANPVIFPPPKTKGRQIADLEDKEKKREVDEWDEIRLAIAADELELEQEHVQEEGQEHGHEEEQEHDGYEKEEEDQEFDVMGHRESEDEAGEEEFCEDEENEDEYCDEDDYPWGADDDEDKKKCKDTKPCHPAPCIDEYHPPVPDCEEEKPCPKPKCDKTPCPEPECDKKPDPPVICKTTEVQLPVNLASDLVTVDILERLDMGFPISRFVAIDWSLKAYNGKIVLPSNVLFLCLVLLADIRYVDAEGEIKSLKMELPLEKTVSLDWINAPDLPNQYDAEYTFRKPGSTEILTQRAACTELTHEPFFEIKAINIVSHEEAVKTDSGNTVIYVQGRLIVDVAVMQKQFVHVITELA